MPTVYERLEEETHLDSKRHAIELLNRLKNQAAEFAPLAPVRNLTRLAKMDDLTQDSTFSSCRKFGLSLLNLAYHPDKSGKGADQRICSQLITSAARLLNSVHESGVWEADWNSPATENSGESSASSSASVHKHDSAYVQSVCEHYAAACGVDIHAAGINWLLGHDDGRPTYTLLFNSKRAADAFAGFGKNMAATVAESASGFSLVLHEDDFDKFRKRFVRDRDQAQASAPSRSSKNATASAPPTGNEAQYIRAREQLNARCKEFRRAMYLRLPAQLRIPFEREYQEISALLYLHNSRPARFISDLDFQNINQLNERLTRCLAALSDTAARLRCDQQSMLEAFGHLMMGARLPKAKLDRDPRGGLVIMIEEPEDDVEDLLDIIWDFEVNLVRAPEARRRGSFRLATFGDIHTIRFSDKDFRRFIDCAPEYPAYVRQVTTEAAQAPPMREAERTGVMHTEAMHTQGVFAARGGVPAPSMGGAAHDAGDRRSARPS